jgi:tripartite-type tricarboxylate transporter receptor subunit TctC
MDALKIDVKLVGPPDGGAPINNLEDTTVLCNYSANLNPRIRDGKLKGLGTTASIRPTDLPTIKPLAEQGFNNFQFVAWYGLWTTKGVSPPILERLNAALKKALQAPDFRNVISKLGGNILDDASVTPDALSRKMREDSERFAPLIRKTGLYSDQ